MQLASQMAWNRRARLVVGGILGVVTFMCGGGLTVTLEQCDPCTVMTSRGMITAENIKCPPGKCRCSITYHGTVPEDIFAWCADPDPTGSQAEVQSVPISGGK